MSYTSPNLYRRDSKGRDRIWSVSTEGSKVIVKYGLLGGKETEQVTTAKPKNVGKSNATTAEEQAVLEAKAKFTKQIEREDYNVDINRAGLQFRPMLALDYLKVPSRVVWSDALVQPKLDGLRLAAGYRVFDDQSKFELMSRKGEEYNVPHLLGECINLKNEIDTILKYELAVKDGCQVIDGEIYKHGWPLQQTVKAAKKLRASLTNLLEYHIFDLYVPNINMRYSIRHDVISRAYNRCVDKGLINPNVLKIVPFDQINSEDQLKKFQNKYIKQGYEGAMIRHDEANYMPAIRSANLFKFKKFQDMECKIINIWKDNNGNAMFTCQMKNGHTFDCTPKRTHEERVSILTKIDDYINKWITVKYQSLTNDGLPQFPVGLDIRDCDENGNPLN